MHLTFGMIPRLVRGNITFPFVIVALLIVILAKVSLDRLNDFLHEVG